MMFRTFAFLPAPLLLLLNACADSPAGSPAGDSRPSVSAGECNEANAQFAVGSNADAQLQTEVRRRSGAMSQRVIRPGDVITMDYSTQRLNLELDANGKVVRARCG